MKNVSSNKNEEESKTSEERGETIKEIVLFSILGLGFICLIQAMIGEFTNTYSYRLSYTPEGKAALIEAANAHEFGEVFNPGFELKEDYVMAFEKVVGVPSPCRRQYFVTYVDPNISWGSVLSNNISWQYALIQQTSATKDLTVSEFVKLANSGSQDLLYGGFVKGTSYQKLDWDELDPGQRALIEQISENQKFGDKAKIKKPNGFISVKKVCGIPSKCPEQTLVSYYVDTPNGYKNEKVLIQGSLPYGMTFPPVYGGI